MYVLGDLAQLLSIFSIEDDRNTPQVIHISSLVSLDLIFCCLFPLITFFNNKSLLLRDKTDSFKKKKKKIKITLIISQFILTITLDLLIINQTSTFLIQFNRIQT
jgi:hypothetical protein